MTGDRGNPKDLDSCTRIQFKSDLVFSGVMTVGTCNGKVNGINGIYINFTGDLIEASAMASYFDALGGHVTNILTVRLPHPPISNNQTARALLFRQNWERLGSVRLALRAELVNVSVIDPFDFPSGTMAVESFTRTVYVLTERVRYCLIVLAAMMSVSLLVSFASWIAVLSRRIDLVSVASLSRILQVSAGAFDRGILVYLVGGETFEKPLYFEHRLLRRSEKDEDGND